MGSGEGRWHVADGVRESVSLHPLPTLRKGQPLLPSCTPQDAPLLLPHSLSTSQALTVFAQGAAQMAPTQPRSHVQLAFTSSPTAKRCRLSEETSRLSQVVTQWSYQVSPLWEAGYQLTGPSRHEVQKW